MQQNQWVIGCNQVDQRLVNALLEREDCPVNATDAGPSFVLVFHQPGLQADRHVNHMIFCISVSQELFSVRSQVRSLACIFIFSSE